MPSELRWSAVGVRLLCVAAAPWLSMAGCDGTADLPGDGTVRSIRVETVVPNAQFPVALAFAPDGRIFYTEKQTGQVRVIAADGTLLPVPFVSVPVVNNSERGLLGITLHPDFANNDRVYLFYTRSATGQTTGSGSSVLDNRVVCFTADGDVAAGDEVLVMPLPAEPGPNHNGGNIRFGPDGKLYITIGELAVPDDAQRIETPAGSILRINDDGSIPADNPFGTNHAVFAMGLRNSFDFAFDPVSGVLFASENGPTGHDEINRIIAGGNYGWPDVQGFADDSPPGETAFVPAAGQLIEPLIDVRPLSVALTGVDFAPDDLFGAGFEGQLFVGEYNTGRIKRYALNADRTAIDGSEVFADNLSAGVTDVAFAPDGSLYVLTSGSVLRIVPDMP